MLFSIESKLSFIDAFPKQGLIYSDFCYIVFGSGNEIGFSSMSFVYGYY